MALIAAFFGASGGAVRLLFLGAWRYCWGLIVFIGLALIVGLVWCLGVAVNTLFCCVVIPNIGLAGFLNFFWSVSAFTADASAVFFICIVVLVGLMTQVYSTSYMRAERSWFIFVALLGVFIVSMCGLVLANSFSVFFIAWELIGFCSFILIGFWCGRGFSAGAAIKAVSVNRFPDMALLLAFCVCYCTTGVSDFASLANCTELQALCQFCFVFAAAGKSAQVGFTGWLLSAMEGPTPVSALMHAATLVTAGIIWLIRCAAVFSTTTFAAVFLIGVTTALLSGISAIVEFDLKQMVALSTASQMGLAFMFVGTCDVRLAFLHISAHAVFKSLLFWGVGVLNHAAGHQYIPVFKFWSGFYARLIVIVAAVALLGTPFLSGFYSKEAVLCNTTAVYLCALFVGACQLVSVLYTCRLIWFWFIACDRLPGRVEVSSFGVVVSTAAGAVLSIASGFFIFFELPLAADFYSVISTSVPQYLQMLLVQPSFTTQLFVVIPWLFFIVLPVFDTTGLTTRLVAGFTDLVGGCDSLINRTLFTRSTRGRASFGEIVSACVVSSILLPVGASLAACIYVSRQFKHLFA